MKNMKTRTQNRTPKRLLSVFLSILMLLSSFVFVNPTVSLAGRGNTKTMSQVGRLSKGESTAGLGFTVYNVSGASFVSSSSLSLSSMTGSHTYTVYSYYDFRNGVSNSTPSVGFTDYYNDLSTQHNWDARFYGNPVRSGSITIPATVNPNATAAQGTSKVSTITFKAVRSERDKDRTSKRYDRDSGRPTYYTVYSYKEGYTFNPDYFITVNIEYYGINTTRLYNLYNEYKNTYGLNSYSDIYTGASWNNYIDKMDNAEQYWNGAVSGIVTQTDVCDAETKLINAVANLKYLNMDLPAALYSSGEGYGYSNRPEKVRYYSNLEFDVDLFTGYTQSVPTVTCNGKTYNGTKINGKDSYHFVIPVEKSVDSIVVNNVKKNTYTVSVPGSATGLSIGNSGNHSVTHGNSFTFTVTKQTGYTQKTPVVKVNGTQIAGVESGNTYTYTITNVDGYKNITVDGQSVNSYSVGYELGEGASKGSGTATAINHFGSATIKITVDGAHNQVTSLPISVSNGTISGGTKSGNTFTYTLSNVTENTTVKVGNLNKNKYTVTIPAGTGYSSNVGSRTVTHGETTTFTITLDAAHNQNAPVAKIGGTALSYTQDGDSYTFTTGAITKDETVEISNIKINKYKYDFSTGEGYTLADDTGFDHTAITHGNDYKFTVTVNKAYTQNTPVVSIKSGKDVALESKADGADGSLVYTYIVKNVTAHDKILVENMTKNTYSAVLPFDADGSYKVTNAKANAENVVEGIVYGSDLMFGVALGEQYDRSKITVKYKGTVLTPDDAGNYTIHDITRNIEAGDIVVEGVELNHYYITLPLETETGFVIEVADGLNAKSVLSGTDFGFRFFLDPAYSNSNPTIKVSRDGGKHYTVLTAENGNEYTIDKVLSDCIVVVENVKKNTYTVKFVDGETVLEEHKDVLYGSDVSYEGATPTRATEKVSETTDENGNTVLVERKYKFIGWSQDTTNVTSNLTVTPIFEVSEVTTTTPAGGGQGETVITKKTATIRFISDGLTIHKETVNKGESFPGWNEVPVKTSSNPYETYEFLGWDVNGDGTPDYSAENNKIENVQDDIELVAVFKSNLPTRTVNFYNFDGSKLLYTAVVKCGSRVVRELYGLDGSPARIDNKYEYTFSGWAYVKDGAKKDVIDKLVIGEGESAIDFFAAYSREKITYTYKYINDGTVMQEGSYNFVDDGQVTDVRYTGETPKRASSKSTDYTFRYWVRSNVEGSRYDYIYTADYAESTREYTYTLPTADGATVALGEGIGETIKWNEDLVFTVTLDEGHDQNAPVVNSNGKTVEAEKVSDNTYKYVIRADGADAEEIEKKLNNITVSTTINEYTVDVVKATNEGGDADASCTLSKAHFVTDYNGTVILKVTLNEGYTQTAPVLTAAEGNRVEITLESQEGNTYTYKLSGVKSNATITVTTKINEYRVIVYNWKNEAIFNKDVKHGSTPDIKTPVRPADKNGAYKFIGYDTNNDGAADVMVIENVTAPVTAKALYDYNHKHNIDPDENPDIWELDRTDKATCTKDGLKYYTCKHGDGQTTTKVIPARGHKWTAEGEGWIVVKAPTCTETGLKSRFCCNEENAEYKACNYKEENVVIPATGHHDADGDYKCDDCGADLGHCSKCICHKGNVLSKVIRKICTILSKTFHTKIKCCKCMKWYGDEISSIS